MARPVTLGQVYPCPPENSPGAVREALFRQRLSSTFEGPFQLHVDNRCLPAPRRMQSTAKFSLRERAASAILPQSYLRVPSPPESRARRKFAFDGRALQKAPIRRKKEQHYRPIENTAVHRPARFRHAHRKTR